MLSSSKIISISTPIKGRAKRFKRSQINWPLIIGFILVSMLSLLAVLGPEIAPSDPLKRTLLVQISQNKWDTPPYAPFTPGFPLGSDQYGRDILSQLLWAIRPTLLLVLISALIRLLVGISLGLISGWWANRISDFVNLMIISALASPVLIISLAVIAKVGLFRGLWPFILGLSITGWAESAQIIRSQTILLRSKEFIESSRAQGASTVYIFFHHVFPHLAPLIWILLSIEIGSSMMLTATLGFLGYYIGGGSSIDGNIAPEAFELGQMLASTADITIQPWAMVAAGSAVFVCVLGFNLIAQGLLIRLNRKLRGHRTLVDDITTRIYYWFEGEVMYPLITIFKSRTVKVGLGAIAFAVIGFIFGFLYSNQKPIQGNTNSTSTIITETPVQINDQAEPTSSPSTDPIMEMVTPDPTNASIEISSTKNVGIAWVFDVPGGISTPPIITDSSISIISHENELYTINFAGSLIRQITLEPEPFEENGQIIPPMILSGGDVLVLSKEMVYLADQDGNHLQEVLLETPPSLLGCCAWNSNKEIIYFIDEVGALHAFNLGSGTFWSTLAQENKPNLISKPLASSDGNIYYSTSIDNTAELFAISQEGEIKWKTDIKLFNIQFDPSWLFLDNEEGLLFWSENIYNADDGAPLSYNLKDLIQKTNVDQVEITDEDLKLMATRLFANINGISYLISSQLLARVQWNQSTNDLDILSFLNWGEGYNPGYPSPSAFGVSENQLVWLKYINIIGDEDALSFDEVNFERRVVWLDLQTSRWQQFLIPKRDHIITIDNKTAIFYICNAQRKPDQLNCYSSSLSPQESNWEIIIPSITTIDSGYLDINNERLYIYSKNYRFYAIDIDLPKQ